MMAKSHTLNIGGSKVKLARSDTHVAVRPHAGMAESMDTAIRSIEATTPVERHGRLGEFEIVHIPTSPQRVTRARANLRAADAVQQEVAVYHTSDDKVPFIPVGTIYLSFKPGTSEADKEGVLEKYALQLVTSEPNGFLTVRITSPGTDAVQVAAKLQRDKSVAVAEPDLLTPLRRRNFVLPTDEFLPLEWHLANTGNIGGEAGGLKQGADARVIAAWQALDGLGSSDVVVGIIDDGFDLSHPDLTEKAVTPWDFERNSDDVHPEPNLTSQGAGDWHGTCCAGVAVGKAGGGKIVGAAPNAKLLPVRTGPKLEPTEVGKWFDHMTDNGASVVSCSWGAKDDAYPLPLRIAQAISRCAREGRNGKGCVIVFAAGNSGKDINNLPASLNGFAIHPDVISVSACSSLDTFSSRYSNFGKDISVCAPSNELGGLSILTADVTGTYMDAKGVTQNNGYAEGDYNFNFEGTSSACPLVAGICALVLSANPDLSAAEVRDIIRQTARKIGSSSDYQDGHSTKFGYGCVNAEGAVREALRRRTLVADAARDGLVAVAAAAPLEAKSALPNLFDFVIGAALDAPAATVETVATAIASSFEFRKAVQSGMSYIVPPDGIPSKAEATRLKLAKAFSAPTAGGMFDHDHTV
jgi:subtilisin family serine protease